MTSKTEMTTLSSILEKLRLRKQDNEFKMTEKGFCIGTGKYYEPEELKIIKTYRFEGESDPSDNIVLYLIEAKDGLMGYCMDAYGAYSNYENSDFDDFIKKIPVQEREDSLIFGE